MTGPDFTVRPPIWAGPDSGVYHGLMLSELRCLHEEIAVLTHGVLTVLVLPFSVLRCLHVCAPPFSSAM